MYYSEQMASDIPIEIYGSPCQSVHGNIGHRPGSQVRQDAHFSHNFFILISYTPLSAKRINPQHQLRAPKSVPTADLKSLPRTWGHQGPWVFNHLIEQVVTAGQADRWSGLWDRCWSTGRPEPGPGDGADQLQDGVTFLAGVTMNIKLSWQHASLSGFHNCSEYFRVLSFNLSLIKLVQ